MTDTTVDRLVRMVESQRREITDLQAARSQTVGELLPAQKKAAALERIVDCYLAPSEKMLDKDMLDALDAACALVLKYGKDTLECASAPAG